MYEEERNKFTNSVLKYADDIFVIGIGSKCEPVFNISSRNIDGKKYAVKLFLDKKVFAVWDLEQHMLGGGGRSSLSISDSWENIPYNKCVMTDIYKELNHKGSLNFEKILLVDCCMFKKFFENYSAYMTFNEYDIHFPNNNIALKIAKKDSDEKQRKRFSTSRLERDSKFRDEVLKSYNYQCAICRCDVVEVLEAAHERGYEVVNTNFDDASHGICLCANHHLMYDNNLIDIDLKKCELKIKNKHLETFLWYKEFVEKYGCKILNKKEYNK